MLTKINYLGDPTTGDGVSTTISYNGSNVDRISLHDSDGITDIVVSWGNTKISTVKVYQQGTLINDSVYTYAGNSIRIDHELFELPDIIDIDGIVSKMAKKMFGDGKSPDRKLPKMSSLSLPVKTVTEIILNGNKPALVTAFLPNEQTGVLEEKFKTEFKITATSSKYDVRLREEDAEWIPFIVGEFTDFENTPAPVTDNTLFLAMNGMFNGGALSYLYLRDAATFNEKNYRRSNFLTLFGEAKEAYTNVITGGRLTEKNIVPAQSENPLYWKAEFTY
jgi:hypothetical protein